MQKIIRFLPILTIIALACLTTVTASCIREDQYDDDPVSNFEQLWTILDENYCFFEYKQIDWQEVHDRYRPYIYKGMSSRDLFDQLAAMVNELKDGHVNLSSAHDYSQYDGYYQDAPHNFNEDLIENNYLGPASEHKRAAGMKYKILDDNVGYIRYASFQSGVGDGNLDEVLSYLSVCNGLIIDIRDNGGGTLTYSNRIAARFTNERRLVAHIQHKTGPGHGDFSTPSPIYLDPSNSIRWQKKVVVLANRRCYSAANDFINVMKELSDNVIILGDRSGGGGGLPFTSELPNGWSIRYSASPILDEHQQQVENGIDPDLFVDLKSEDEQKGRDTLIEEARKILKP